MLNEVERSISEDQGLIHLPVTRPIQRAHAERLVEEARSRRRAQIDNWRARVTEMLRDVPPATQQRILRSSAIDLLSLMDNNTVSSVQVVSTFTQQCCEFGFLGALAQPNFDEAIVAAEESDARRARHRASPGSAVIRPLEGLPLSVKDEYLQAGHDSTCGIIRRVGQPAAEDGALLSVLRQAGAIPFVRSNLPQLVMSSECDNHVWGRCCNPYDVTRTCGGSSGGEAALLASRCSVLGIGTDIAGSLRIPAAFTGVCSFRPTPGRMTLAGTASVSPAESGQALVLAAPGPMARCVDDLALLMSVWLPEALPVPEVHAGQAVGHTTGMTTGTGKAKALWDWDPAMPRLPFKWDLYDRGGRRAASGAGDSAWQAGQPSSDQSSGQSGNRGLRIGYFTTDYWFTPAPSCRRAVLDTAEALASAGHDVVPWDPYDHRVDLAASARGYCILFGKDSLADMGRHLGPEPWHPLYLSFRILAGIPDTIVRWLVALVLRYVCGWPRLADIVSATGTRSMLDAWQWNADRNAAKNKLLAAMQSSGIDLLLCPAMGLPAWPHGGARRLEPATSYCWHWNYLQMPAGVVPVTTVRPEECEYNVDTAGQRDPIASAAAQAMAGAAGLPVAVQLVGRPFDDEQVLRGMREVEQATGALARELMPEMCRQGG